MAKSPFAVNSFETTWIYVYVAVTTGFKILHFFNICPRFFRPNYPHVFKKDWQRSSKWWHDSMDWILEDILGCRVIDTSCRVIEHYSAGVSARHIRFWFLRAPLLPRPGPKTPVEKVATSCNFRQFPELDANFTPHAKFYPINCWPMEKVGGHGPKVAPSSTVPGCNPEWAPFLNERSI